MSIMPKNIKEHVYVCLYGGYEVDIKGVGQWLVLFHGKSIHAYKLIIC